MSTNGIGWLRRQAAAWYGEGLAGIPGISLPHPLPDTEPVYHVFVILAPDRDILRSFLKEHGIETGIHYPYALNTLPAYAHRREGAGHYPRAEQACRTMLSLPMFPGILKSEVDAVCAAIREHYAG